MTRPNASLVQREVARHYGAPAKTQRQRVWWGEEVRRRERDLPRLSGARRGILSPHRRVGGIVRLTAPVSGLPAWWGRCPLGVPFERAKGTKTRLGRSPLRTSLGYGAVPASSLSSALAPVRSHGWPGKSMGSAPFSVSRCRSFQGLTLVCGVSAAERILR